MKFGLYNDTYNKKNNALINFKLKTASRDKFLSMSI